MGRLAGVAASAIIVGLAATSGCGSRAGGSAGFEAIDVDEVPVGGRSWDANATAFRGRAGAMFLYVCPAGGSFGSVWGTNVYTDDSSVCSAAVHAGLLEAEDGGRVVIRILPGRSSYEGSRRHGVATQDYGAWPSGFAFVAAEPGGGRLRP
jgi:hypothetical protein